jgi:predicted nucleotidyltransferase
MTILQQREAERRARLDHLWRQTREELRSALAELLPGEKVVVFGSLAHRQSFSGKSDVDVALFREPPGMSIFALIGTLEERLCRPVDVVLLDQCRFGERIYRTGETWTL